MKKTLGSVMLAAGLLLMVYFLCSLISEHWEDFALVQEARILVNETAQPAVTVQQPTKAVTQTVLPTIEPTKMQTVKGYILGKTIDLSSGDPVALVINLPDGGMIKSNWAGTKSFETDDPADVFLPGKGIIYSYLGDVTTTWAHSGVISGDELLNIPDQTFFATELDRYVRKDANSRVRTLAQAQAQAESLIGSTAYLCQIPSGEVKSLSDFEGECQGKKLELTVVAFAIVPHEKLSDYDEAIRNINQWMQASFPGTGFEQITKENGWIVRFCVGKLADQTSDGSPWYLYNRGVIGFQVKDGSS